MPNRKDIIGLMKNGWFYQPDLNMSEADDERITGFRWGGTTKCSRPIYFHASKLAERSFSSGVILPVGFPKQLVGESQVWKLHFYVLKPRHSCPSNTLIGGVPEFALKTDLQGCRKRYCSPIYCPFTPPSLHKPAIMSNARLPLWSAWVTSSCDLCCPAESYSLQVWKRLASQVDLIRSLKRARRHFTSARTGWLHAAADHKTRKDVQSITL